MLLLVTDPTHERHVGSPGHIESPQRLAAVLEGVQDLHLGDGVRVVAPRRATELELSAVHDLVVVELVERLVAAGGGAIDADTGVGAESLEAALLAAGSGLAAVAALEAGSGDVAFCAVRPPGHHATPTRSMGFCLFNNIAVLAADLVARGERVVIVDVDAHHGNGTAKVFECDPRVLFVSLHQWPLYPGTGRHTDIGESDGAGTTLNVTVPPGATGDVYLHAWDELVAPAIDRFAPTWLLVSMGVDAHRADPLTDLGLSAGDFADLAGRMRTVAPPGRCVVLLEGGYDLPALRHGTAAMLAGLLDFEHRPEGATSGGPGHEHIDSLVRWWSTVSEGIDRRE